MDITNRTIWQQASGDTDTIYGELCLEKDVILNGPGNPGPWSNTSRYLPDRSRKNTDLFRFCEVIKPGDIVVLRLGTTQVLGVGEVVGEYLWNDEFGDVDGWDIQHVRRVRWLWSSYNSPQVFPVYSMKQGDTTQILDSGPVIDWLKLINIPPSAYSRDLKELPATEQDPIVDLQTISEYLFDQGVASR